MLKRIFAAVVLSGVFFAGCSDSLTDERTAAETSAVTSEIAYREGFPTITPANELYDVYPVKIIYAGEKNPTIKADTETIIEELYNSEGQKIADFHAVYPVINELDRSVRIKINGEIKNYIDGILNSAQEDINTRGLDENGEVTGSFREFYENDSDCLFIGFHGDSAGKNFFCVNFDYIPMIAGTAPGHIYPTPMIFDLRNGERVNFENFISDKDGFAKAMETAFLQYAAMEDQDLSPDKYAGAVNGNDIIHEYFLPLVFGTDDKENYLIANNSVYERIAVRDGCIGFYFTLEDTGIGRSDTETYFAGVPLEEAIPYLNDEGKALLDGYRSAESEPANIVEYKGEKYFDTVKYIPDVVDTDNITYADMEFISLFNDADEYFLKKYGMK